MPFTEAKRALSVHQGLLGVFPKIEESHHLSISLRNPGAVVHLGVMYGVDDYTVVVLVGLSDEFQELKKAIAAEVQVDFMMLARCTSGS